MRSLKYPSTLARIQKASEGAGFTTEAFPAEASVSLVGYRADMRVGFQAFWLDGKWHGARIVDPVGVPQELWGDYMPRASGSKRPSAGRVEWGRRMGAEYNDGKSWLNRTPFLKKANDFYLWLDDWRQIVLGDGFKRLGKIK